ncbi:MAG: hypothetical protein LW701_01955 [Fluviicola sp.]|jgi:hypothetical protein|nr:hypothetical protein [Fluviicola sp.]
MDLRKIVRQIIKEEAESQELQTDFGDKDKARRALIALSKGLIPDQEIKVQGSLSPEYPDESGHYSEDGEVEIEYSFEGSKYLLILSITGDYYYKEGFGGDYWQPPDEGEWSDEDITLNDDEFSVGDQDDNEYNFNVDELGSTFKRDMEKFLLGFYDAMDSSL